jgi:hypothetical protein
MIPTAPDSIALKQLIGEYSGLLKSDDRHLASTAPIAANVKVQIKTHLYPMHDSLKIFASAKHTPHTPKHRDQK